MPQPLHHNGSRTHRVVPFLIYVIGFHVAWIGWAFVLYPQIQTLGEATLQYALVNISLRLLIWVLPVLLYLRYIDEVDPLAYLKLKHNWQRGVQVGLILSGINFLLGVARYGLPHPSLQAVTWNSILSTSLLIGVIEEIPYRGFMLQKLQEWLPFWAAALLSSLLFVGVHLPGWIALNLLRGETVVFVFCFGVVMAVVFRYTNSLWSVIVAHSLNDFLAHIVFGR